MPDRRWGEFARQMLALGLAASVVWLPLRVAAAEGDALPAGAAVKVTRLMDADAGLKAIYNQCPADVYRTRSTLLAGLLPSDGVTTEYCSSHPNVCFASCNVLGSSEYCFKLAVGFQAHEEEVEPRYAQMLFSMACALGRGSGCTNRAASIRNRRYEQDPFLEVSSVEKNLCLYRSFQIDCAGDGAWGCAMLGQSYRYGEGVTQSDVEARQYFAKSCALAPEFAACEFAKSSIEDMAGAPKE